MPKMKPSKSIAKRFKVTKSGQLKRQRAGRRHLAQPLSGKGKRRLRRAAYVLGKAARNYKELMCV
ncbi:MAG: 50S ribosomal protein L35 [Planctomycetes bacterium]|nr:50S ribosomal protein L35 [Planctomycetota bacterium]